MTPEFTWKVQYWIERHWLRWRVVASYGLMFPPDGGASHSIGLHMPRRYWLRRCARAELMVRELTAEYGEPKLDRRSDPYAYLLR